jgi:hypothetical protein
MIVSSTSELTWILMKHVPRAYSAHLDGSLESTKCWKGSKPFFFFSKNHVEVNSGVTYGDKGDIYDDNWELKGVAPDYKSYYSPTSPFTFDKPVMVVNNKFIIEWGQPPVNFLNIDALRGICETFKDVYDIVYIRSNTNERGYWNDAQPSKPFNDYEVLRNEYGNDITFMNDMFTDFTNLDYNTLQIYIHSLAVKFISVAGGNAVISSYFGGENIIYRNGNNARTNGRKVWHSNSKLSTLSNAKIIGVQSNDELTNELKLWK